MNFKCKIIFFLFFCLISSLHAAPLKIGVRSYYPPFEMVLTQNKQVTGFEVDILMEICKRMQMHCVFMPYDFAGLFTAVSQREVSLAIGAISITPEREEAYLFSLPYFASKGQFVVTKQSKLTRVSEVCSLRVGYSHDSVYKYALAPFCKKTPYAKEYVNIADAYSDLAEGNLDALVTDVFRARYWMINNSVAFKYLGDPISVGLGYAIMANKKDGNLIESINKYLIEIENDGTYLKLYRTYFSQ